MSAYDLDDAVGYTKDIVDTYDVTAVLAFLSTSSLEGRNPEGNDACHAPLPRK
jgi:hypothetical protein